jgi:site-specific recombinase XerC
MDGGAAFSGEEESVGGEEACYLRTFFQFLIREGKLDTNPAKLVATPSGRGKAA